MHDEVSGLHTHTASVLSCDKEQHTVYALREKGEQVFLASLVYLSTVCDTQRQLLYGNTTSYLSGIILS